jgi:hypothetical protein
MSRLIKKTGLSSAAKARALARKEDIMTMSNARFIRPAGLSTLIAGSCYFLVGAFHPANVVASVAEAQWTVVHVLAVATSFFGVFGLAGLHARQASRTGWLGLVGTVLLSLWLVIIMGFSFVEAFILPTRAR